MFDKFVAGLLTSYLGEYFEDIDTQQVNVSVWKGDVRLRHIKVRKDALRFWRLPVCVSHGLIEELRVQIPWTRLASESVVIQLLHVVLVVEQKLSVGYDAAALRAEEQMRKQRELDAAEEAMLAEWVEKLMSRIVGTGSHSGDSRPGASEKTDDGDGASDTFSARLKASILNNIKLEVQHVELRYRCATDGTPKASDQNAGPSSSRAAASVSLSVDSFKTYACNAKYLPDFAGVKLKLLHKALDMKGIRVATLSNEGPHGATRSEQRDTPVVSPFDASVKLQYQPVPFESTIPTYLCAIRMEEVHTQLNEHQWRLFLGLMKDLWVDTERLAVYTKYRPSEAAGRPTENPRAWWRYATRAVLGERRKARERGRGTRFHWGEYLDMKRKRERYTALYMRARRSVLRGTAWLRELSPEERDELATLEKALPLTTLVFARQAALLRVDLEREEYHKVAQQKRRLRQEQHAAASADPSSPRLDTAMHEESPPPAPPSGGWFSRWWSASTDTAVASSQGAHSSQPFAELSPEDKAEMQEVVELVSAARWTQMQRLAVAKEFGLTTEEVQELSREDTQSAATTASSGPSSSQSPRPQHQRQQQQPQGVWCKCLFQFVSSSVKLAACPAGARGAAPFVTMRMDGLSTGLVVANDGDADAWLTVHAYTVTADGGLAILQRRGGARESIAPSSASRATRDVAMPAGASPGPNTAVELAVPLTVKSIARISIREELNANLAEVLRMASVSFRALGERLAERATLSLNVRKRLRQSPHAEGTEQAAAHGTASRGPWNADAASPSPHLLAEAAEAALASSRLMPYDVSMRLTSIDVRLHVPLLEKLVLFFTAAQDIILSDPEDAGEVAAEGEDVGDAVQTAQSSASQPDSLNPVELLLPETITLTAVEQRDLRDAKARVQSLKQRVDAAWLVSWRIMLSTVFLFVADGASASPVTLSRRVPAPSAAGGERPESPQRRTASRSASPERSTHAPSQPPQASLEQATAVRLDGLVAHNDPASILRRRARAASASLSPAGKISETGVPARDGSPTSASPFATSDEDWLDTIHVALANVSIACRCRSDGVGFAGDGADTASCASAASTAFQSAVSVSADTVVSPTGADDRAELDAGVWHHVLHPATFTVVAKRNLLGRREVRFPALSLDVACVSPAASSQPCAESAAALRFSWSREHLFVASSCLSYVIDFFSQVQRRLLLVKQHVVVPIPAEAAGEGKVPLKQSSKLFGVRVESLGPAFLAEDDDDEDGAWVSPQSRFYQQFSLHAFEQRTTSPQERQVVEVVPGAVIVYHRQRPTFPKVFYEILQGHFHVRQDEESLRLELFVEQGGMPHEEFRKGVKEAKAFLVETLGLPARALRNVVSLSRCVEDWIGAKRSGATSADAVCAKLRDCLRVWERASHTVPCHHATFMCDSVPQLRALRHAIQQSALRFGRFTPSADVLATCKKAAVPDALANFRLLQVSVRAKEAVFALQDNADTRGGNHGAAVEPFSHAATFTPFRADYEQLPLSQIYTCTTDDFALSAQGRVAGLRGEQDATQTIEHALALTQMDAANRSAEEAAPAARKPIVLRTEVIAKPFPLPSLKRTTLAADTAMWSLSMSTALLNAMDHLWDSAGILSDRVFSHTIAPCTPFLSLNGEADANVSPLEASRAAESRWRESPSEGGMWLHMAAVRAGRLCLAVHYPSDRHELNAEGVKEATTVKDPRKPMLVFEGRDALLRWKRCGAESVTNFAVKAPSVRGGYPAAEGGRSIIQNDTLVPVLWSASPSTGTPSMEVTVCVESAPPTLSLSDFLRASRGAALSSQAAAASPADPSSCGGFRFTQHLDVAASSVHMCYVHPQWLSLLEVCTRGMLHRCTAVLLREAFFIPPRRCPPGCVAEAATTHGARLAPWPRQEEPGPSWDWCGMEKRIVLRDVAIDVPLLQPESASGGGDSSFLAKAAELTLADVLDAPADGSLLQQQTRISMVHLAVTRPTSHRGLPSESSENSTKATRNSSVRPMLEPCDVTLSMAAPVFRVPSALSLVAGRVFDVRIAATGAAVLAGAVTDYKDLLTLLRDSFVERPWLPVFATPRPDAETDPYQHFAWDEVEATSQQRILSQFTLTAPTAMSLVLEVPMMGTDQELRRVSRTCVVMEQLRMSHRSRENGSFDAACTLTALAAWDLTHVPHEQSRFATSPAEVCDRNFTILQVRADDDRNGTLAAANESASGLSCSFARTVASPPSCRVTRAEDGTASERISARVDVGVVEVTLVPRFLFNLRDTFFSLAMRNAMAPLMGWPQHVSGDRDTNTTTADAPLSQKEDERPGAAAAAPALCDCSVAVASARITMPRVAAIRGTGPAAEPATALVPFFLSSVRGVALTLNDTDTASEGSAPFARAVTLSVQELDRIGVFLVPAETGRADAPRARAQVPPPFRPLLLSSPPPPTASGTRPCGDAGTTRARYLVEEASTAAVQRDREALLDDLFLDASPTREAQAVASPSTASARAAPEMARAIETSSDTRAQKSWFTFTLSTVTGVSARVSSTWVLVPRRRETDVFIDMWIQGGFRKLPLLTQFREERGFLVAAVAQTVKEPEPNSWLSRAFACGPASLVFTRPSLAIPDHGLHPTSLEDLTRGLLLVFGEDITLSYTQTSQGGNSPGGGHAASLTLAKMHLCAIAHPEDRFLQPFSIRLRFAADERNEEKKVDVHVERLVVEVDKRYYEVLLRTLVEHLLDGSSAFRAASAARRGKDAASPRCADPSGDAGDDQSDGGEWHSAVRLSCYLYGSGGVGGVEEEEEEKRERNGPRTGARGTGASDSAPLLHDYLISQCMAASPKGGKVTQRLRVYLFVEGLRLRVFTDDVSVLLEHDHVHALLRTAVSGEAVASVAAAAGARGELEDDARESIVARRGFAGPSVLRVISALPNTRDSNSCSSAKREQTFLVDEERQVHIRLPRTHIGVTGRPALLVVEAASHVHSSRTDTASGCSSAHSEQSDQGDGSDLAGEDALRRELTELSLQSESGVASPATSTTNRTPPRSDTAVVEGALAGTFTSMKRNREESVSCQLGTVAINLDAASVAAAVLVLYKPYAETVLPAYQLQEMKVFDRDVTLTEDLILTARTKLRISNARCNHVTINAAGHNIYFDPEDGRDDAALLLLDEGLTLRILHANLFLRGNSLDNYTQAGNGSYVLLDRRTNVLQTGGPSSAMTPRHRSRELANRGENSSSGAGAELREGSHEKSSQRDQHRGGQLLDDLFRDSTPASASVAAATPSARPPRVAVLLCSETNKETFRKVMGGGQLRVVLPNPTNSTGRHVSGGASVFGGAGTAMPTASSLVLTAAMRTCVVDHVSFPSTQAGTGAAAASASSTDTTQTHRRDAQGAEGTTDRRATVGLTDVCVENVRGALGPHYHSHYHAEATLFAKWGLKVVMSDEAEASTALPHKKAAIAQPTLRRRVDIMALSGVEMHLRYSDVQLCTRSATAALDSLRFALGNVDAGAFTALFGAQGTVQEPVQPTRRSVVGGPSQGVEGALTRTRRGSASASPLKTATYSLVLPYASLWIVNDRVAGLNEPLFHVRVEKVATPVWEVASLTTKCQLSFSFLMDVYDVAASAWSPLLERVPVSAMLKVRRHATVEDVQQRRGITKLAIRVGDVKTYVSPAMLRAVQRLLRLRDDFIHSELQQMLGFRLSEDAEGRQQQQQQQAQLDSSTFCGYKVVQHVGNVCFAVGFPHDFSALLPGAGSNSSRQHGLAKLFNRHGLTYMEEFPFNFPRVDGNELPRSQQCVAIAYEGAVDDSPHQQDVEGGATVSPSSMAIVNVANRGRCALSLGPIIFQDHVLVDVSVNQSQKVVTLRTNVQVVNDLPLDVELLGPALGSRYGEVDTTGCRLGLLESRSSRCVPIEWIRNRVTLRPVAAGMSGGCEAASLGICFDSLPDLKGETLLCVCRRRQSRGAGQEQPQHQQAAIVARGSDFEIRRGLQRAIYFLLKVSSPRSVAPSTSSVPLNAPKDGSVAPMIDCTARITAPFFITNAMGVPIHVTLMTQTVIQGKKLGLFDLSPETYVFDIVASVNINPGERYGVTEVDPFTDVRMDVSLTQSNGGTLGRNGSCASQPQYMPALIYSPHNKTKYHKRLTIVDDIAPRRAAAPSSLVVNLSYAQNEVTLWCSYWIVNQTLHVLQFCDGSKESGLLLAGLGLHRDDGVMPSATTPFLYNSDCAVRLGEKAHLFVRIGHDFPAGAGTGTGTSPAVGGGSERTPLRWSQWSEPLGIGAMQDASTATCALTRTLLATVSFSVELGTGEAAGTRIITFRPRWVILNKTQHPLVFRQSQIARARQLAGTTDTISNDAATSDTIASGACHVMDLMAPVSPSLESSSDPQRRGTAPVWLQVRYAVTPSTAPVGNVSSPAGSPSDRAAALSSSDDDAVMLSAAWSTDFRIDALGDHTFNVQYERLVPMAEYWPQDRAGVQPTALPPLCPDSIIERNGELFVKRPEADVLHVSCYRAGSLTFVDVARAERPPYVVENRTEYVIHVKQHDPREGGRTTSRGATTVYPKTTKAYTWEVPSGPPRMHLWATNGHTQGGSEAATTTAHARRGVGRLPCIQINFDPREVVKNPLQFQQEIDLSNDANALAETKMLFVRVRGVHGASYAISITEEPTVDAYRTLPYAQCFYQLDVQSLYTAFLAPKDGDAISANDAVALVTVKPLRVGFAQAAATEERQRSAAGLTRDVQHFDIHLRTVQLDDERSGAKEKVVLQLVDTASPTSVKWERALLRSTPLVYSPHLTVTVAPVELHVEDSFISAALEYADALQQAWLGGSKRLDDGGRQKAGALLDGAAATTGPALRRTREALLHRALLCHDAPQTSPTLVGGTVGAIGVPPVLRLSGGGRAAAEGQAWEECRWVGEALEKAGVVLDDPFTAAAGAKESHSFRREDLVSDASLAAHEARLRQQHQRKRRQKRHAKEDWRLKTILVDRLLIEKLYVTVSLYRSPGAANDPLRKHFGVTSLLIRSIKDAKLDWPRIDQRGVCDTVWLLADKYSALYKQRLLDQAPNLISIAGLDTMRGFVSDLLTDYFTFDDSLGGNGPNAGGREGTDAAPPLKKERRGRRGEASLALDTLSPSPSLATPTTRTDAPLPTGAGGASVLVLHSLSDAQTASSTAGMRAPIAPLRNVTIGGVVLRMTDVALRYPWSVFIGVATAQETRQFGILAVRRALRQQSNMPVYNINRDTLSAEEVLSRAAASGSRSSHPPQQQQRCTRCAEVEAMLALQRFSAAAATPAAARSSTSLFHPREGSLTWAEYLHHVSWNEFLRGCTDEEVMAYRTAMLLSVIGEQQNVIRLSG